MQKVVGMFGLQLLAPRMKNIFQNVAVFLDNFVFLFLQIVAVLAWQIQGT